jgi:hypothetical protein
VSGTQLITCVWLLFYKRFNLPITRTFLKGCETTEVNHTVFDSWRDRLLPNMVHEFLGDHDVLRVLSDTNFCARANAGDGCKGCQDHRRIGGLRLHSDLMGVGFLVCRKERVDTLAISKPLLGVSWGSCDSSTGNGKLLSNFMQVRC